MSGKKYLVLLGILAVAGFGVCLGVSVLLGRSKPPAAAKAPGAKKATSPSEALLAGLSKPAADEKTLPEARKVEDLIKDLRARVAECERKDRMLTDREHRLSLAEENLRHRAKELETLRMELVGPLTRLKDAMAELDRRCVQVDKEEKANLQRIAATFDKMDAAKGSSILAGMCANNQVEDAVKILAFMSERSAGKVLAEMTDQALAARLTAMWKKVREQG